MSNTKHTQEEWMKAYNALMDEECPGEANYDYFVDPTEKNIEKRDARLAAYTKWITKRNSDVKTLIDELKESPAEVRFNLAVNVALKSIDKNMCRIISDVAALVIAGQLTQKNFDNQITFMDEYFPNVDRNWISIFQFALQAFHSSHKCRHGEDCYRKDCEKLFHSPGVCIQYNNPKKGCRKYCGRENIKFVNAVFEHADPYEHFVSYAEDFHLEVEKLAPFFYQAAISWNSLFVLCKAIASSPLHKKAQKISFSTRFTKRIV